MFFWICFLILALPLSIIYPVKYIGKKHIKALKKKKQNYIISCNHMSNMDALIIDIKNCTKYRYLGKKELFKNKFTSACLRSLGVVSVDRSKADVHAVKEVLKLISKKKNIGIFPQGTRAKTPMLEGDTAKEGVAMFAIRTDTPVVPMMFDRKLRAFHRTKLYVGEAIYPDATRKHDKEYLKEFSDLIITKMNELIKGEQK